VNGIKRFRLVAFVFVTWTVALNVFLSQAAGQEPQPQTARVPPSVDVERGKTLFEQDCSTCHGVDASGGDGPDLHGVPASLGDPAVRDIIRRGIPGTAMQGFYTISEADAASIVAYIRTLDNATTSRKAPGDPEKGEAIYNSSGCSACHMIAGEGGSIGPELTRIGARRGASSLKERLLDPGTNLPKVSADPFEGGRWIPYLMYRAVEKDGHVVEGVRVGEDSFTIVLKDASGRFHGLSKPDLRSLEKEPGKSFMPSFKDTLSQAQLDDLVAYLLSLKGTP
jgi:cytochrome c oxidase cbb3-type subunit III